MQEPYNPPAQSVIHGERFSNPEKYKWAIEKRDAANLNHWLAQEVNMTKDIQQWKTNQLTPDEQRIVKRNLGFFVTADSLAANNIVLGTLRHIRAKEPREFLYRQAYDEGVHTESYQHIVESLGMDEHEIFNSYMEIPSIAAKDNFLLPFIEVLSNPEFKTGTFANDQALLKAIFAFACIMEGLFFYVGFVQILALGRQNKVPGSSQQYTYILRDESLHANFGMDLFNTIRQEVPALWTEPFKQELRDLMVKGVELEYAYAVDTMPRGVLGLNAGQFHEYLRFIANRRCRQTGLGELYQGATNPFPWMSEALDLRKEVAFFERQVQEYTQGSALSW